MSERKSVLLRFEPHLLERVDDARGAQNRTEFLLGLISEGLGRLEEPVAPPTHMMAGATRGGLFASTELQPGDTVRVLDGERGAMNVPPGVVGEDGRTIEFHEPSDALRAASGDGGPGTGTSGPGDPADLEEPQGPDSGPSSDPLVVDW